MSLVLFSSYGATPYFAWLVMSGVSFMSQYSVINKPHPLWPTQKIEISKTIYLSIYLSIFIFFSLLNKNLWKNSYFYYEIRFVSKQMLCFPKAFIFWWTELAYFPGPTQELNFKMVNFYYFVKKFFIQKKKKFMSF